MPLYDVEDSATGLKATLEGDSPPSPRELEYIFGKMAADKGVEIAEFQQNLGNQALAATNLGLQVANVQNEKDKPDIVQPRTEAMLGRTGEGSTTYGGTGGPRFSTLDSLVSAIKEGAQQSAFGISAEDIPSGANTTVPAVTIPLSSLAKGAAGVVGYATSGQGLAEMGAALNPITRVPVLAKWTYDMLSGGYMAAKDAVQTVRQMLTEAVAGNMVSVNQLGPIPKGVSTEEHIQRLADDAVNTALMFGGAAATGAHLPSAAKGAAKASGLTDLVKPPEQQGPVATGELLKQPKGAPAPRQEAATVETTTPAQSKALATAMNKEATAAYEPPKPSKPSVPETPPEAERGMTVIEEIRAKNLRTKEQIRSLFPQLSREQAAALRNQAWGKAEPLEAAAEAMPQTASLTAAALEEQAAKNGSPVTQSAPFSTGAYGMVVPEAPKSPIPAPETAPASVLTKPETVGTPEAPKPAAEPPAATDQVVPQSTEPAKSANLSEKQKTASPETERVIVHDSAPINFIQPSQKFLDPAIVEEYKRKIEAGEPLEPIKVIIDQDTGKFSITDGHHRYEAARQLGLQYVPVAEKLMPYEVRYENNEGLRHLGRTQNAGSFERGEESEVGYTPGASAETKIGERSYPLATGQVRKNNAPYGRPYTIDQFPNPEAYGEWAKRGRPLRSDGNPDLGPDAKTNAPKPPVVESLPTGGKTETVAGETPTGTEPPKPPVEQPAQHEPPKSQTALKYADLDADRVRRGKEPLVRPTNPTDVETHRQATEAMDKDSTLADRIIDDVLENPRQLDRLETHIVNLKRIEVRHLRELAEEAAMKLQEESATNPERAGDFRQAEQTAAQLEKIENRLAQIEEVGGKSGSMWGLTGHARQVMMNEDISLAAMERRIRKARGYKPLTPDEIAALRKEHDAIAQIQKSQEALSKSRDDKLSDLVHEDAVKSAEAETPPPFVTKLAKDIIATWEKRSAAASEKAKKLLDEFKDDPGAMSVEEPKASPEERASRISEVSKMVSIEAGEGNDIRIIYDENWRNNSGLLIEGATDSNGRITVNAAVKDQIRIRKAVREELAHRKIASEEGQALLSKFISENPLSASEIESLKRSYKIEPSESPEAYLRRLNDEFIAKQARENTPIWRSLVEKVKAWLASKGLTKLTNAEAARAILRSLKNRKPDSGGSSGDKYSVSENGGEVSRFSVVEDPELLNRLEKEPTIKVFRAMQLLDGELYPPMSAKVEGEFREPTKIGVWEKADERPDLADNNGNFLLDKANKSSIKAKYNPYFHTSRTPLNDQFSSAYKRPNLVTVEVEVPASELTSGYKAEKAKDSVGEMTWHSGPVSGKLPAGKKRRVILSRYAKVVRVVPDSEVALQIKNLLGDEKIQIPSNVVTPSLRSELENVGVKVRENSTQRYSVDDENSGTNASGKTPIPKTARYELTESLAEAGLGHLGKVGKDFESWSKEMTAQFGEKVNPFLKEVWDKTVKLSEAEYSKRTGSKDVAKQVKKTVETPQEKIEQITERISKKIKGSADYDISHYVQKLARALVQMGVRGRDNLVDKLHEILKPAIPDITRREVAEAYSGYGKFTPLSKDADSVLLRAYRGELQQVLKLEDMAAGQAPLKTGSERRIPSDEERRLQKQVNEAKKDGKYTVTDPDRQLRTAIQAAETRLRNQITDLDFQIRKREKTVKTKNKLRNEGDLPKLRRIRDELKARYDEVFKDPPPTAMELRERYKDSLVKKIRELEEKDRRGDFSRKAKKVEIEHDQESLHLQYRYNKARQSHFEKVAAEERKGWETYRKVAFQGSKAVRTIRTLLTTADLSAVMRQGLLLNIPHPKAAAHGFVEMFKAFASPEKALAIEESIRSRPNSPLYNQGKLFLSDYGATMGSRNEEMFMASFAEQIPGLKRVVGASSRAYSTFLNVLRADVFDTLVDKLAVKGKPTPQEVQHIANFINVATGRGSQGLAKVGNGMSLLFFAPRYLASRFQYALGQPLYGGTANTRKIVAAEYAKTLAAIGTIYGLAKLAGANIGTDPRSSDFGKLIIDDTRVDLMAGLNQITVLGSRLATGETANTRGVVSPIRGKVPYGRDNARDVIMRFFEGKLSPAASLAFNAASGITFRGDEFTPTEALKSTVIPITYQDIYEIMKNHDVDEATALSLLAIFGAGVQHYEPRRK